jgi:HD superfamily phosphodiesterase
MLGKLGALLGLMAVGLVQTGGIPDAPRPAPHGDWRASVREFARAHFRHPAWGYSHSVRDYDLARRLAKADHVVLDDDVLFAAAFLHDMAAFKPWEDEKVDHADKAAELMADTLQDTGFPMAKLEAVRAAIRTHMFEREPVSPEARYLHDADALDWLGAIGVARVIALADPNGGEPDGPAVVKMLDDNLRQVPSRVLSPAGRQMMPARRDELQRFLRELRDESDQLRAL